MKFLQLTAGAVFLLSPLLASADGTPEDVVIGELERAKLELERDKLELEREVLELERANTELKKENSNNQVAATSISRDSASEGNGGEFYASDRAAQFTYERFGSLSDSIGNSRTTLSFVFSEARDVVLIGGAYWDAEPTFLTGLRLSFGVKAYGGLIGIENQDAIAFGGSIEGYYPLPIEEFPLTVSAGFGAAPDILSFGQADNVIDWFARIGLRASDTIDVFFGFRFLQFDTQPGDTEIDERLHLGVRWKL